MAGGDPTTGAYGSNSPILQTLRHYLRGPSNLDVAAVAEGDEWVSTIMPAEWAARAGTIASVLLLAIAFTSAYKAGN
ncbi:hypothetical protein [Rubidibacter lacunae]|uniref:hypothetical protein n=1 Tax=Rubidibacter lacunae TaxID=582514 RepID=UPI000407D5B3|nr:hypothetical protein [Rubidibacter lacunae]